MKVADSYSIISIPLADQMDSFLHDFFRRLIITFGKFGSLTSVYIKRCRLRIASKLLSFFFASSFLRTK